MNINNASPSMRLSKQAIDSSSDYKCEKCEHIYFVPVFALKHISALMSPNGKEINFPVQTFACAKCNHVNEEFIPKINNESFA